MKNEIKLMVKNAIKKAKGHINNFRAIQSQKNLNIVIDNFANLLTKQEIENKEEREILEKYIGKKVITASTAKLSVGVCTGIMEVTMAKQPTPLVTYDDGIFLCFGAMTIYDDRLMEFLNKLNDPKDRFDVVAALSWSRKRIWLGNLFDPSK